MRVRQLMMAAAVAAMASCGAQAASLGYVTAAFTATGPGKTAPVYWQGNYRTSFVGMLNYQVDPTPGTYGGAEGQEFVDAFAPTYTLGAFCVDLSQYVQSSYKQFDIYLPAEAVPGGLAVPLGSAKADNLARLFEQHLGDVNTDAGSAAFQAAVWEIAYEALGAYDLSQGQVKISTNVSNPTGWGYTAQQWLANLGTGTPDPNLKLRALKSNSAQDFAVTVPDLGTQPPVPEPLTMVGVLTGLGLLARRAHRRAKAGLGL